MAAESGFILCADDKLDGPNYPTWSFLMQNILIAKDLWEIVTGEEPRPASSTVPAGYPSSPSSATTTTSAPAPASEAQRKWDKRNALALSLICLSIKRNLHTSVRHLKSASLAWETLSHMFDVKNEQRILQMRSELSSIRMNETEPVLTHLNKMKAIGDSLKELGDTLDDKQLVSHILGSLGSAYEHWVMSLTLTLRNNPITLPDLTGLLLQEELRRQNSNSKVTEQEKAFYSKGAPSIKCKYCKKAGHTIEVCYKRIAKEKIANDKAARGVATKAAVESKATESNSESAHAVTTTDTSSATASTTNVPNLQNLTINEKKYCF